MGKGIKHKCDWKETTLQVVIDARRLYIHTVKIMGNRKNFSPQNDYNDSTLIAIQELLLDTYQKLWLANRINVKREPEMLNERVELQKWSIINCKRVLSLFELAKSQFHIPSGKFWNLMSMAETLGKRASAWNKSDVKRYSGLLNQDSSRLLERGHPPLAVSES